MNYFILSSPIFFPHIWLNTQTVSTLRIHMTSFNHEFCWWKQKAWRFLIFHCINFLSVVKQAYQCNTLSESKFSSMFAALIACVPVVTTWQWLRGLFLKRVFLHVQSSVHTLLLRKQLISSKWNYDLCDSICKLAMKCTAFTISLWCCKLVSITWNAFLKLVVHSSPFLAVAGTKIYCIILSVCMYEPWIFFTFFFFFSYLPPPPPRGSNIKP